MTVSFRNDTKRKGEQQLVQDHIALTEGSVQAGPNCYFGCPISPQNTIPEYLSWQLPQIGDVFLQAESELASINLVLGAAVTGTRAMTSSSGPGIALMQEGLSFIAEMELPCVIVNIMRCDPGLGGITLTQADYFQATRGGRQGDYRTLVLAPNRSQEMFDFVICAFELADHYRNPVHILSDAMLEQMKEPTYLTPIREPVQRPKPWALSGVQRGMAKNTRSMCLDGDDKEFYNYALVEKYARIEREIPEAEVFYVEDAEYLVAAFGSAYPFPSKILENLTNTIKGILVIELNMGQTVEDIRLAVPDDVFIKFYGRPGGGIPTPRDVVEKIKKI